MTSDILISPSYNLDPEKSWFTGPETIDEDFGSYTLYGTTDFHYEPSDSGITVHNNKVIRRPAVDLAAQGLHSLGLIFESQRSLRLFAVITHDASGLFIATDLDVSEETSSQKPGHMFTGVNDLWTEGENRTKLYWFQKSQALQLSRFNISFTR